MWSGPEGLFAASWDREGIAVKFDGSKVEQIHFNPPTLLKKLRDLLPSFLQADRQGGP